MTQGLSGMSDEGAYVTEWKEGMKGYEAGEETPPLLIRDI